MYHNRYSYVLNNPLKYTDPTGQRYAFFHDNKVDNEPIYNFENSWSSGCGGGGYSNFGSFDNSNSSPYYNWSTGEYMQGGNIIGFNNAINYYAIKYPNSFRNATDSDVAIAFSKIYGRGFSLSTDPKYFWVQSVTGRGADKMGEWIVANKKYEFASYVNNNVGNSNTSNYLTTTNTILGALGVGWSTKEGLIEFAQKFGNVGKSGEKYLKFTNFIGKATGYASAATAWYDYSQNQTTTTSIKAIGNSGIAIMHINPFVGIGLGILDLTGGTDLLYNRIGNYIYNNQWKQKP